MRELRSDSSPTRREHFRRLPVCESRSPTKEKRSALISKWPCPAAQYLWQQLRTIEVRAWASRHRIQPSTSTNTSTSIYYQYQYTSKYTSISTSTSTSPVSATAAEGGWSWIEVGTSAANRKSSSICDSSPARRGHSRRPPICESRSSVRVTRSARISK